jgi:hypothetical protein
MLRTYLCPYQQASESSLHSLVEEHKNDSNDQNQRKRWERVGGKHSDNIYLFIIMLPSKNSSRAPPVAQGPWDGLK